MNGHPRSRRRVLIVSHFYKPEPCAAANRIAAMTRAFVQNGDRVTVLTGMPSFPAGRVDAAYRKRVFVTEERDGVSVQRVWTFASPGGGAYRRVLNWVSVAGGMLLYLLWTRRRFDLVVVSSPPVTLILPGLIATWRSRAMLIADIRDVFPEVGVTMGAWKDGGVLPRLVGALVDRLYARATLIVAVTEGAREEILRRGVPPAKVTVASNGADPLELAEGALFVRRPGDFVAAYVGNMGSSMGLDAVLDAAKLLGDDNGIRFVMVGGGAHETELRRRAGLEGISNVSFLGPVQRSLAARALADSDVCIVPLRKGLTRTLPTKIFDAFSVGCPVITAAEGEARAFVQDSGGGIAVDAQDGAALAAAIRKLRADPQSLAEYGRRGRAFLAERHDRSVIMRQLVSHVGRLEEARAG